MNDTKGKTELHVGIGDFKIGEASAVVKTFLGSCVGICFYDKNKKIGALLHIMLPTSQENRGNIKLAKYADTGIRETIRVLVAKHGVDEKSLVAKIFGGAKVIKGAAQDIGKANIKKVKELLKDRNINIIKEKTGGEKGYKIIFNIATGEVRCQIYGEDPEIF